MNINYSEFLDATESRILGMLTAELTGNSTVYMTNHRGIAEYGTERIVVVGSGVNIEVCGTGLELTAMNESNLIIRGEISSLSPLR